ncbi:MAG: class I SAM-dependent methyltransferase [Eubacteriales bacterium]
MSGTIVTTSHKPDAETLTAARDAAAVLGIEFVERNRMSLVGLRQNYGAENILVINREQIKLYTPLGECFFHPSMSIPRIKAIRQGKPDHMVEAMDPKPGDSVLDCTLGLAADAIVAATVVGPGGRVVGIETSPELAFMVKHGLAEYGKGSLSLREAMSRIEVVCGDSGQYLAEQADNSFDIVYFDPMFRFPRTKSSSMQPLRGIVNSEPLNSEMINDALRVARKLVVMKENEFSREFARLGFSRVLGGKYSPVAFGVIDKQEAEV